MTPDTDIAQVLRETPVRYGNETEDQSKGRRQREREMGAAEITRLRADLARLTAERDEARREACALRVLCTTTSQNCEQIAAERGWDCFEKEAKP